MATWASIPAVTTVLLMTLGCANSPVTLYTPQDSVRQHLGAPTAITTGGGFLIESYHFKHPAPSPFGGQGEMLFEAGSEVQGIVFYDMNKRLRYAEFWQFHERGKNILSITTSSTPPAFTIDHATQTIHMGSTRNADLIYACGGQGVDFVTGNCVDSGGNQYQPRGNPSRSPSTGSQKDPGRLIFQCGGRAVDFVTGKCL